MDWYKIGGGVLAGGAGLLFLGPLGGIAGLATGWLVGGAVEPKHKGLGGGAPSGGGGGYQPSGGGGGGQTPANVIPPHKESPYSPPTPATPQPPIPPQPAVDPGPTDARRQAAINMNTALSAHGYKKADMPLYMAYQRLAGLTADGYPGQKTMQSLTIDLTAAGQSLAPVHVYTWSSSGGYDGVNAPTVQEWIGDPQWQGPPPLVANYAGGTQAVVAVANVDSKGTPTASQVAGAMPVSAGTPIVSNQDVQRALNTLGYASPPLIADGVIGPKSKAAVIAFQKSPAGVAAHLAVDGAPGPMTKAALQKAIANIGG